MTVRGGGSSSVFSIALADAFWLPRSLSASNRISTLRSPSIGRAVRLGEDRLADVVLDPVRRAARLELDDVGMHAALARAAALRSSSATPMSSAANVARRVLDARTARPDEEVRVRRALGRARERVDRALLPDDVRRTSSRRLEPASEDRRDRRPRRRPATSSRRAVALDERPAPRRRQRRGTRRGPRRGTRRRRARSGRGRRRPAPRRRRRGGRARRRGRVRARRPRTRSSARPRRRRARGRRLGTRASTA